MPPTPVIDRLTRPAAVRRQSASAVFAIYGLTGFTGLLAEQGFEKYIALLVGATASASAVVLFTYFLGFALGGVAAARWIARRGVARPVLAYGIVELLVGASCVAFSYSFHSLAAILTPLHSRFLSGCILVLPTAALMGASFPLIAHALDASRWSRIYGANLAGAFLAALVAPMGILPWIGLRGAMWLCFGITTLVCLIAMRMPRRDSADGAGQSGMVTREIRLLLAAAFASGAIFFALEVLWTHLIGVVIGCSIYAFSWMLAAVLGGLLLGAFLAGRVGRASLLFQCCALLMLVQLRLWDHAPLFFNFTPPPSFQDSFYFAEIYKLAVALLLLGPPATALGLIYPRLLRSPQLEGAANSHLAGYMSAANSMGCLSGALLGVFVLVPRLGSEVSLKLIVGVLALFSLLFVRVEPFPRIRFPRAAVMALVIAVLLVKFRWDWGSLTAGLGNYFGHAAAKPAAAPAPARASDVKFLPASFAFRHEDVQGGFTTVVQQTIESPGKTQTVRTLYTNGKFQGDDNPVFGEAHAQFGFSAVPSLFVHNFGRALLIGLGTGQSATALKHLGYREIDVAEFSAGIVEAARMCYGAFNESILDDPRVRLYLEDGRNVLLTDPGRRYDLITIEISSIWFAGSTNLYSKEFYELVRQRLNPDGVLQQWVQLHHISPREIASDLATAAQVFPYVGLWYYGGQGMLVAANHPLVLENPQGRAAELYASRLVGSQGVARLVRELKPVINTDHNRWIEYSTPRYQSTSFDWTTYNRRFLEAYR